VPTSTERQSPRAGRLILATAVLLGGCGPSPDAVQNRRELEALLTAVSLKDAQELERDAGRIAARREAGGLSDAGYADLRAIIDQARLGDWPGAERRAYDLRSRRPYFR
jgi:hypothetical protein